MPTCRLVGKSESWRVGGAVQEEEVLVVASASGGWCRCCEVDGRRPGSGAAGRGMFCCWVAGGCDELTTLRGGAPLLLGGTGGGLPAG